MHGYTNVNSYESVSVDTEPIVLRKLYVPRGEKQEFDINLLKIHGRLHPQLQSLPDSRKTASC